DEVGDLCREHAPNHDLTMKDIPTMQKLAHAVHETKTCHYGVEATVFLLGPLQSTNYAAIPFIVSPTCKTEKWPQLASTLDLIMDLYPIYIQPYLGPLFMTSTDGNSVFHTAQHNRLTCYTPPVGSALYIELAGLLGFNMTCGKNEAVMGPDPKHVVKRE
ncbi:hypothetical protein BT96DRAFT_1058824, partial [Gymnopus androsaceus JB14]